MKPKITNVYGVRGYIDRNGTAQLNLEDVARGLGFVEVKGTKKYVMWRRVDSYLEDLSFGTSAENKYIPENIFYRLAMKAKNETAENFQAKVADEILPAIRKTGGYIAADREEEFIKNYFPSFSDEVKQAMVLDLRNTNQQLKKQIEQDKPKVIFAESLQVSQDSILVGELAKLLRQNGIDIGEKRLFQRLRDTGYLIKSGSQYNLPTQRSMDLGIMEIKVGTRMGSNGASRITRTTKITGKGQMYFVNKFIHAASKGA